MKNSLMKLAGMLAIASLIALGCDSVVDQNSSDTSEFQVQSPENYLSVGSFGLLEPFTQDELDNNWFPDRRFPTGGVNSVQVFGRDNVAKLAVIGSEQSNEVFQQTEGIKTGVDNFGQSVQVDLYLDPDWQDKSVATGLWVVGDDGEGGRDNFFGIQEFINLSFHNGWSYWESGVGYTDSNLPFEWGTWVTVKIELNADLGNYIYSVDGEVLGSVAGGSNYIREVFLNTYNFGNSDYASHWHAGINPITITDCQNGGWEAFGFRNQGQCIRYVNTGQDSR